MKIKLNKQHSNKCPRCKGLVRYCNCDIISKKPYTQKEIEYINEQK